MLFHKRHHSTHKKFTEVWESMLPWELKHGSFSHKRPLIQKMCPFSTFCEMAYFSKVDETRIWIIEMCTTVWKKTKNLLSIEEIFREINLEYVIFVTNWFHGIFVEKSWDESKFSWFSRCVLCRIQCLAFRGTEMQILLLRK